MPELHRDDAGGDDVTVVGGKAHVRRRDKVRGVWISFVGRIVAQIIGAIASVVLGIFILQQYQERQSRETANAPRAPAPMRAPGVQAIAVLPLDNFSPDPNDAYFAAGMTEVLISDLAQLKGWSVVSRTSTEVYRETTKSISQIASELNANLLVEGSVLKAGDRVRVVIQLIDGKTDEHLFARTYDRAVKDVLTLHAELAAEIAKSLKAAIPAEHESRLNARAAFDPAVYDLYLRGRHAWNLRTPEGLSRAVALFTEATTREPDFALAHVGLADAHLMGGSSATGASDARGRYAQARASAERAIGLASHMAEAHTALGGVQFFGERDYEAAEDSFKRAIELNSNYPIAHEWYAVLLSERGRDGEARKEIAAALKLDPMEATMHQASGLVHYHARRFQEAIAAERRALEIRPQLPLAQVLLLKAQVLSGDAAGALRACADAKIITSADSELVAVCAIAAARAGDQRAAAFRRSLENMRPRPDTALLQLYAATGELDRAWSTHQSLRGRNNLPPNLTFDPLFEELRSDPRYAGSAR